MPAMAADEPPWPTSFQRDLRALDRNPGNARFLHISKASGSAACGPNWELHEGLPDTKRATAP
jgi:hypothetical protein